MTLHSGSALRRFISMTVPIACALAPFETFAAFTDATSTYGLTVSNTMSYSATAPDIDGDGFMDLYIGNHWKGPADLYRTFGFGGIVEDSEQYGTGNSDRHDQIWADFDNDGDPDQYISHGAGHPGTQAKELFWNLGNTTFIENADGAGVNDEAGRGRECSVADFNRDGWLDLFVANDVRPGFQRPNRLYWNDHDHTFTQHPNDDPIFVTRLHSSAVDYNQDGYPDICVSTPHFHPGELYRNDGDSTFTDVTTAAFPGITEPLREAQGTSWADIDDDGDLDLFTVSGNFGFWDYANQEGDSIRFFAEMAPSETKIIRYVSQGDFVTIFAQSTEFSFPKCYFGGGGDTLSTYPMTLEVADMTGYPPAIFTSADGLFVWSAPAGGTSDSVFVVLRGKATAGSEIGGSLRPSPPGISSWVADDFDPPAPYTRADWTNRLFRNEGNGTFKEITQTAFAVNGSTVNSVSATWGDYDNDGRIDVFVANCGTVETLDQPDYLYRNNGNGTFTEVAAVEGVQGTNVGMSDGGAWVDMNSDGFLDLFVNHGAEHTPFGVGPRRLYMNSPNGNHWMMLELQGIQSNGSGIGARVRFSGLSGVRWRTVLGETDNGYAGFTGVHVGLGLDSVCDTLQIYWPSGVVDTHLNIAADSKYFAIEGAPLRPLQNPQLDLSVTAVADTMSQAELVTFPLTLTNSGGAAVHFSEDSRNCAGQSIHWLYLNGGDRAVWPGSSPEFEVVVDPTSLPFGPYCGRIIFESNSFDGPDTLEVNILVFDPNVTGAGDIHAGLPFGLEAPRPNPFTGASTVSLTMPRLGSVDVAVYDLAGHRVRRLAEGAREPGRHALLWDGHDDRGRRVAPGAYFVRALFAGESRTRKLILLD